MNTSIYAATEAPLYDFSRLGKLGQKPAFVREIKQMFVLRVPTQLAELQAAVVATNWVAVAQVAHSLKSTFGNLRMDECAGQLRQIEVLAQRQDDQLQQLVILRAVQATTELIVTIFSHDLQAVAA
jgi:two-component system aerobic respiration control sensor histidine kinase ArcB